jgi:hypothetical protein
MEDDMMERLLAFLLAGALVAPQIGMASESGFNDESGRQAVSKFPEKLPLPPVPYLDTMPWINLEVQTKWRGIDTLLPPDVGASARTSAFADNFANNEMLSNKPTDK